MGGSNHPKGRRIPPRCGPEASSLGSSRAVNVTEVNQTNVTEVNQTNVTDVANVTNVNQTNVTEVYQQQLESWSWGLSALAEGKGAG